MTMQIRVSAAIRVVLAVSFAMGMSGLVDGQDQKANSSFDGIFENLPEVESSKGEAPVDNEIQNQLDKILDSLPADPSTEMKDEAASQDSESSLDSSAGEVSEEEDRYGSYETEQDSGADFIAELEQRVADFKGVRMDLAARQELQRSKKVLELAKTIYRQLDRTFLSNPAPEEVPAEEDWYVLARIEVANAQSTSADVRFTTDQVVMNSANSIYQYILETAQGGFRDYRIMSRHKSEAAANEAIKLVRAEYDAAKERERQMIAYIKKRNAALARIKASRRC